MHWYLFLFCIRVSYLSLTWLWRSFSSWQSQSSGRGAAQTWRRDSLSMNRIFFVNLLKTCSVRLNWSPVCFPLSAVCNRTRVRIKPTGLRPVWAGGFCPVTNKLVWIVHFWTKPAPIARWAVHYGPRTIWRNSLPSWYLSRQPYSPTATKNT